MKKITQTIKMSFKMKKLQV